MTVRQTLSYSHTQAIQGKRMRLRNAIIVPLALVACPAVAGTDDDGELWTTLGAGGTVSGRLLANVEAIARFSGDEGGPYEAEFGGFLGYRLTGKVSLWAGYVRVPRYARGAATSIEDRTRQQVTADLGQLGSGSLFGRMRIEQRFREGGGTGWRLRPQLKYSRPLVKDGAALVFSHESFLPLNTTGWGQRAGYERMRNFAGVSAPVAPRLRAEFGYLNQYDFRRGTDSVDHAAALTASYSF